MRIASLIQMFLFLNAKDLSLYNYVIKALSETSTPQYGILKQPTSIGVTWRGGGPPPPISFLPKNNFLLTTEWKRSKSNIWSGSGGRGFMYIKDWFKPIFLLSLTGLPRALKFLIPMVDFAPPPKCY